MNSYGSIIRLVWPLALGMINNAVMQFVDRAYLAHESIVSLEAALPACALAGVFIGFFQSVVGFTGVVVAQYSGAGDEAKARSSYRAGLAIAALSGLAMVPFAPLGDWIFSLSAARPELLARESAYYDIVILGAVFLYGQMAATSYFTGRGRTRLVFWVNLAGNLVNIALDPVLIFACGMGIRGAAYATVFSQLLQFAVLVLAVRRAHGGREAVAGPPVDFSIVRRILRFGVPAGGYEVLNMLSFTIFVFVTGTAGEVEFAVSNACFTITYLLFAPLTGLAVGAQTLVGQYCGRGDHAGAELALRRTVILAFAFSALAVFAVLVFNRWILGLFAPAAGAEEFLDLGFGLVVIMSFWLFFDALDTVLSGGLKGAGDTRFVFWWMMISAFGLWLPLVFAVKAFGGSMVQLWLTMVVYVVVISVGSLIRWRLGRWRRIRVVETSRN